MKILHILKQKLHILQVAGKRKQRKSLFLVKKTVFVNAETPCGISASLCYTLLYRFRLGSLLHKRRVVGHAKLPVVVLEVDSVHAPLIIDSGVNIGQ